MTSAGDLDEAFGRATLRKISWRILPLIGLGYAISYMDRINISFAAAKMNHDLHFSASIYGLGAGLFFVSYALFEVPSNLLLVKVGARRWIARIMLTWGLVAVAMMFVRTPLQFYIVRFLLGLAEAGFFPGVIYYLGLWFPVAHRGRAVSRFYIAWPLSTVLMGAISGALLNLGGTLGLSGWQWLFIVEGVPAIVMSVVILRLMPDNPQSAPWLDEAEKHWVADRLATDAAIHGAEDHSLVRALLNPVVLMLGAMNLLSLGASYAFTFSAPVILGDAAHLNPTQVGYVIAAAGLAGMAAMLFNGWRSDVAGERYLHLAIPLLLTAAAYAVIGHAGSPLIVLLAFGGSVAAYAAYQAVVWSVPGELIAPHLAAASVAAINSIGMVGSFVAPFAWGLARDATGDYRLGTDLLPAAFVIPAIICLLLARRARTSLQPAAAAAV